MAVFYLELLVRITIQNKDRVGDIWTLVVEHIKQLVTVAGDYVIHEGKSFLLERTVNGLLKMAVRLARKEDLASMVVQQVREFCPQEGAACEIIPVPKS